MQERAGKNMKVINIFFGAIAIGFVILFAAGCIKLNIFDKKGKCKK